MHDSLRSSRGRRRTVLRLCAVPLLAALLLPAGTPAFAGPVDASDSCATATPLASGAWHHETLSSIGDVDWYQFTRTDSRWALITLGGLGADYRLDLFGACGALLASSNRSGIQYEEIYRSLPAGTYHLRVESAAGAVSADPYGLRLRPLANTVQVLSSSGWLEFTNEPRIAGEVLNNTDTPREDVKIRIRFYDKANVLLKTRYTWARRERMPGRSRSMFVWGYVVLLHFDHYRADVVSAPVASAKPFTGLTVIPGVVTPDGFGGLTYQGTLHNPPGQSVGTPRVMLTIYDAYGRVKNAEFNDTTPDPMAPGSSNAYSIYLSDRNTGNRIVFTAHGYPQ